MDICSEGNTSMIGGRGSSSLLSAVRSDPRLICGKRD
jgi:hypothetical protein